MNFQSLRQFGLTTALAATFFTATTSESRAQSVTADFSGAESTGEGWYYTDWFEFFNASFYPWIYKLDGGWFYVDGDDDNLYLWGNTRKDWLYTNKGLFPWYVSFGDGEWREYPDGISSAVGAGGGGGSSSGGGNGELGVVRANMSLGNIFNGGHRSEIEEMANKGVKRLRLTVHTYGEKEALTDQINYATANGLEVAVTLVFGSESFIAPFGTARGGGVVSDKVLGLSDIDMDRYKEWIDLFTKEFKSKGCTISEIEVGNEPNWFDFNGDLPVVSGGAVYRRSTHPDVSDLPAKVVAGAQKLGEVYEATLDAVNANLGGRPVVMLGSLPKVPSFWVSNFNGSQVYPEDWLRLMKGTYPGQSGKDYLRKVEAYGFHFYPALDYDDESTIKSKTADYIENFVKPVVSVIGTSKPFFVTELGISKSQVTDQAKRRDMFTWSLEALEEESSISKWPWETSYIYAWDDGEWAIEGSSSTEVFKQFK